MMFVVFILMKEHGPRGSKIPSSPPPMGVFLQREASFGGTGLFQVPTACLSCV